MPELLSIEESGGVAVVTLDNPPLNALSTALLGEIEHACADLQDRGSARAVVVTGNEKALSAGADISELGGPDDARRIEGAFRHAFDAVAALRCPVIAAIEGYALGGGLELAMCCDLRVAGGRARLGQPEILLGIIPGAGGTQRLPRLVGPARAKQLIWSGHQVSADEALEIGLVDRVVDAGEALDAARRWAGELARGPTVAIGYAKEAIDAASGPDIAAGLDLEADRFVEVFESDDARVGVESFREHGPGKATFSGR